MSSQQMGVAILFVSIGVLFAASLVAYLITRAQVQNFRPGGAQGLPGGLAVSTALLLGVSISLQWAYNCIRKNRQESLQQGLWIGGALAVAFLLGQTLNWVHLARTEFGVGPPSLFGFTFYFLTGVHAAHVVGGLVPLGIVLHRAHNREYSSSRHEGVKLCVQYWHYLGVIWLVLLTTIAIAT